MHHCKGWIVWFLFLQGLTLTGQSSASLRVMSFNIRYDQPADGVHAWQHRKDELADFVKMYAPDVLGLQEVLVGQLSYLQQKWPEYHSIGVGREDGREKGEFAPVFYRRDRFRPVAYETIWLSETGDTASVGWDAALTRICTYVALKDLVFGDTLYVFNTHFDHQGPLAREGSSGIILSAIEKRVPRGAPVIVMGDINAGPDSGPVRLLLSKLQDPAEYVGLPEGDPRGTFNGWDEQAVYEQRIDYIFYRDMVPTTFRQLPDRRKNGRFLSDHFPVLLQFIRESSFNRIDTNGN